MFIQNKRWSLENRAIFQLGHTFYTFYTKEYSEYLKLIEIFPDLILTLAPAIMFTTLLEILSQWQQFDVCHQPLTDFDVGSKNEPGL